MDTAAKDETDLNTTLMVSFRALKAQKAMYEEASRRSDMSVSEWIRERLDEAAELETA